MKRTSVLVLVLIMCLLVACSSASNEPYLTKCEEAYKELMNATEYHYIVTNEFKNGDAHDVKESEAWCWKGDRVSFGITDDITQWTAVIDATVYLRTISAGQDQGWQKNEGISVTRPWDTKWEDLGLTKAISTESEGMIYIDCKTATSDTELGAAPITFCFDDDRLVALIYRDQLIDATDTQWDVTWTYRFQDTATEEISEKIDRIRTEILTK